MEEEVKVVDAEVIETTVEATEEVSETPVEVKEEVVL